MNDQVSPPAASPAAPKATPQTAQVEPPSSVSPPTQPVPGPSDLPLPPEDERLFAAIGYVGPLFILSVLVKPKSEFCRLHARQSMVLFGVFLAYLVLFFFEWRLIGSFFAIPLFAAYVLAIYRAYKGDWWRIPLVSAFAGKIDLEKVSRSAGIALSNMSTLKEKAEGLAKQAAENAKQMAKQEPGKPEEKAESAPPSS